MSTPIDQRKSLRVIAFTAKNPQLKTVNVVSVKTGDKAMQVKEVLQLTAAQAKVGVHETVMAAPSVDPHLKTIYIAGYSGPS